MKHTKIIAIAVGAIALVALIIWGIVSNLSTPTPAPTVSTTSTTTEPQTTSSETPTPSPSDTPVMHTTDPGPTPTQYPSATVGARDYTVTLLGDSSPTDMETRLQLTEKWIDLTLDLSTKNPYPGVKDPDSILTYATGGALADYQVQTAEWENPRPADLEAFTDLDKRFSPWTQTVTITQGFIRPDGTLTLSLDITSQTNGITPKMIQFKMEPCTTNPLSLCVAHAIDSPQAP